LPPAIGNRDAITPALAASLLCLVVVSVLSAKPDLSHMRQTS
jgi:hypothetical protein